MRAITPLGRPVRGTIRPPGSKSLTNRALVASALARPASSRLYEPLIADDTVAMREALRSLGVLIDDNDDPWLILGSGGDLVAGTGVIDVGASGTTARFITAMAALVDGETVIDGTARMRERPIGPLVDALESLGVEAEATEGGYPPVRIRGKGYLRGGEVVVDSSVSSQFASAMLLVAPMAEAPTMVELGGEVVSRPYLEGTVEVMRAFGAEVVVEGNRFEVSPGGYTKAHLHIEADASAAVYPAVAAAITGGSVIIVGLPAESSQPDRAVLDHLESMGCVVEWTEGAVRVQGPSGPLSALNADLGECPDGAMALAVAGLFADAPSHLSGLSTLRVKETDRLAALEREINRVGGRADAGSDTLSIAPGPLHGAEVQTYDDHRMAMSMALLGLKVEGVAIAEPDVVAKTWPGYFQMLEEL